MRRDFQFMLAVPADVFVWARMLLCNAFVGIGKCELYLLFEQLLHEVVQRVFPHAVRVDADVGAGHVFHAVFVELCLDCGSEDARPHIEIADCQHNELKALSFVVSEIVVS